MARRGGGSRRLRWNEAFRLLEKGAPQGCFFLCGPELFLKREVLATARRALLGGEDQGERARYTSATFRAGSARFAEISAAVAQAGLFGAEQLVILEEAERLSRVRGRERDAWLELLGSRPPNPLFLLSTQTSRELAQRSRFLAKMMAAATVVEFWHLFPRDAARWLVQRGARRGFQLSNEAALLLVGHLGSDLLLLSQELEKLSLLQGEGRLGVADLRAWVRRGLLGSSWDCIGAALGGAVPEALERLQAVRREETAFSFAWKLSRGASNRLLGERVGFRTGGGGQRAGSGTEIGTVEKKALGRLLGRCYEWERRIKSGIWSGTHDYVALEAILIEHGLRGARQAVASRR
ncbi:MAG: hypothetical protein GF330_00495 [Candidatus Eisenbacteria bacterium]|nr:hypothetical protein [Candidatus Eisenbacteria bacterium]